MRAALDPLSRNLIEIVRRHHAIGAPTARRHLEQGLDPRGEDAADGRR